MNRKILLLPLLIAVVAISGCTIPGTGISIPIPGFGQVTQYENDVIIVKSLQALPDTVAPGQPIKLVAYVQNVGNKQATVSTAELYDYCSGQFTGVKVTCPGKSEADGAKCSDVDLLPGQVKEIDWKLTAASLKLPATCNLKVRVLYPYTTDSLSTISFVEYQEYQRLLSEGQFRTTQPALTLGYGPVKPALSTQEQQPIPWQSDSTITASFVIENRGGGYVPNNQIAASSITFSSIGDEGKPIANALTACKTKWGTIEFVQQKSSTLFCENVPTPSNVAKESTVTITTSVSYDYEFRSQADVKIQPAA